MEEFAKSDSVSARGERAVGPVILFSGVSLPVFVLAVFAKNEKADLSLGERNALAKLVAAMIEDYQRKK